MDRKARDEMREALTFRVQNGLGNSGWKGAVGDVALGLKRLLDYVDELEERVRVLEGEKAKAEAVDERFNRR